MKRFAAILALSLVFALGTAAQQPPSPRAGTRSQAEHWVATWATSQTLLRSGAGIAAGPGRSGTPLAAPPSDAPARDWSGAVLAGV